MITAFSGLGVCFLPHLTPSKDMVISRSLASLAESHMLYLFYFYKHAKAYVLDGQSLML